MLKEAWTPHNVPGCTVLVGPVPWISSPVLAGSQFFGRIAQELSVPELRWRNMTNAILQNLKGLQPLADPEFWVFGF